MSRRVIDERRRQAATKWEEIQKNPIPFIYIGAASCGLAAGAAEAQEAVEKYLKKHKTKARIIQDGCIGPCYLGRTHYPRVFFRQGRAGKIPPGRAFRGGGL
jgi:hypothetical protein